MEDTELTAAKSHRPRLVQSHHVHRGLLLLDQGARPLPRLRVLRARVAKDVANG